MSGSRDRRDRKMPASHAGDHYPKPDVQYQWICNGYLRRFTDAKITDFDKWWKENKNPFYDRCWFPIALFASGRFWTRCIILEWYLRHSPAAVFRTGSFGLHALLPGLMPWRKLLRLMSFQGGWSGIPMALLNKSPMPRYDMYCIGLSMSCTSNALFFWCGPTRLPLHSEYSPIFRY